MNTVQKVRHEANEQTRKVIGKVHTHTLKESATALQDEPDATLATNALEILSLQIQYCPLQSTLTSGI